jgi:hypothetical protein
MCIVSTCSCSTSVPFFSFQIPPHSFQANPKWEKKPKKNEPTDKEACADSKSRITNNLRRRLLLWVVNMNVGNFCLFEFLFGKPQRLVE